ncbi:MAG: efflux RND transporter periplasmic adaptor subunit [Planctomycetaceae bacterium]
MSRPFLLQKHIPKISIFNQRSEAKVSVVLLATIASILSNSGCESSAPVVAEQPVPKVTIAAVIAQEVTDYDDYTGRTEASEIVEVRPRVFGYLTDTHFQDGDLVKEGQTLFTIESDEYDAIHKQSLSKIALWEAKAELAKANLARRDKLLASQVITQEEHEEYSAAVREANAATEAARADANRTAVDLKYTDVKAQINGRVDRALVSKGNLLTGGLSSGTLLTKIVNEQPMYVYFDVDERSMLRYMRQRKENRDSAPGSLRELDIACYLQLADEKDFPHEGKLDFAASEVDVGTGTARLRGVFTNENRALISGMFVRVRVPVSKPYQALLVPESSLGADQDVKYLYVVEKDGTATRRPVELGAQRGELRIVKSGVQSGEQVIVKGLQRVRPGQKVEAEVEKQPAAVSVPQATEETKPTIPQDEKRQER